MPLLSSHPIVFLADVAKGRESSSLMKKWILVWIGEGYRLMVDECQVLRV